MLSFPVRFFPKEKQIITCLLEWKSEQYNAMISNNDPKEISKSWGRMAKPGEIKSLTYFLI